MPESTYLDRTLIWMLSFIIRLVSLVSDFEQISHQHVEVDDVVPFGWYFALVQILEELVHVLWTELEVVLHLLDPLLVHDFEATANDVPDFQIVQRAIVI